MSCKDFTRGVQDFAIEFHKYSNKEEVENVFVSPLSMFSGLGMMYLGAKGTTLNHLTKGLGFDGLSKADIESTLQLVLKLHNTKGITLKSANGIYVQKKYEILPQYIDALDKYFKVEARNVDFMTNREETREEINAWVKDITNGMIPNAIDSGSLTDLTRIVIVNAVYFYAKWATSFQSVMTSKQPFTKFNGATVPVDLMRDEWSGNMYTAYDKLQCRALQMDYVGQKSSMLFLLPNETGRKAFDHLRSTLNAKSLQDIVDTLESRTVAFFLPRFKMEQSVEVTSEVPSLGLVDVFATHGYDEFGRQDIADFSGITGDKDLSVSAIIHSAMVEVNEIGTQAAAVTRSKLLGGGTGGPVEPPPVFRCDRPFFFFIRDHDSGFILFSGELVNPCPIPA